MAASVKNLETSLDKYTREELRLLAQAFEIGKHDLLLIGDGSGEDYTRPMGWSCIAYDRLRRKAVVHAGSATVGTNNVAELLPYIHALWHFDQEHPNKPPEGYRVAIVSDSELTVRCGNGKNRRRANGCFWASIAWFESQGYVFKWVHVRRNTNHWNRFVDQVAGLFRLAAVELRPEIREAVENMLPVETFSIAKLS